MKLIVSAIKCMSNTIGMWNLPEPKGATALVATVNELIGSKRTNIKRAIIVSDGDDNFNYAKEKLISGFLDDGSPVFCDVPPLPNGRLATFDIPQETLDTRRNAIATHFTNLGVEMFVVGVGTEVKDFIHKCAQKGDGINTALIESAATAEDVGAIMTTVVKRARRSGAPSASNDLTDPTDPTDPTDKTVTASNAEKIAQVEVAKMETESKRTTSYSERKSNLRLLDDGPPFETDAQMAYVKFIVEFEASKNNLSFNSVLAIITWFRSVVERQNGAPVAGALIGGRLYPKDKHGHRNGPVFDVPNDDIKPSAWTNTFNRILELLSREPKWILDRVDGLHEHFAENIAAKKVGPLFAEVGMPASFLAITGEDLPSVNRTLYYKFKEDTYTHYVLNHRANALSLETVKESMGTCLDHLALVHRGNSGPSSYGGPILPELQTDPVPPTPPSSEPGMSGDEESTVGDEGEFHFTAQEQVNRLKRKVEVLETANEQLKKKLESMKSLLAD